MNITIRLAGRKVHLVRQARECDDCSNHAAHAPVEAQSFLQSEINSAVYRDASALADYRQLAESVGLLHDAHRVVDSQVLEHVAWLLQTGRLIAVECRIAQQESPMEATPAPPIKTPRPRQVAEEPTKTWVEIELLDATGKPVPNEPYLVTVPEGLKKSGKLDGQGRARISGIDPGMCQISFPEIDGREWK